MQLLFAVSETDSDHAGTSSQVKKGQSSEKKVLDRGRLPSSEEQIRFVVVYKAFFKNCRGSCLFVKLLKTIIKNDCAIFQMNDSDVIDL